ncbi:3-hydroxyacyl-CoA dehydrogenase family protein [Modestobacter sp. URMC 112]
MPELVDELAAPPPAVLPVLAGLTVAERQAIGLSDDVPAPDDGTPHRREPAAHPVPRRRRAPARERRAVDEVDVLLRKGAGHPMGPLALIDPIGLDVTVADLESMAAVEDDPRLHPAQTLQDLAAGGRLGRKTGAGFHTDS